MGAQSGGKSHQNPGSKRLHHQLEKPSRFGTERTYSESENKLPAVIFGGSQSGAGTKRKRKTETQLAIL